MRLRVLHAPFDVAGQASSLASAERSVGLASESVALSRSGTARERHLGERGFAALSPCDDQGAFDDREASDAGPCR